MKAIQDTAEPPDHGTSDRTDPVSIIIPVFNRASVIQRAVQSALTQCDEQDEIIVIDDGSTDDSEKILAPFGDRITYERVPHAGVSRARNYGLRLAHNPLVAFLDSDDEWLPHKLEFQRRLLTIFPQAVFCFSDTSHRVAGRIKRSVLAQRVHGVNVGTLVGPPVPYSNVASLPGGCGDFSVHIGNLYGPLLRGPLVWCSTAMVRKDWRTADVMFPEDLSYSEDWQYFSLLARRGDAIFMNLDTALMHVSEGIPQLINEDGVRKADTMITVLQRVWATDEQFKAEHGAEVEQALWHLKALRYRRLLLAGRKSEAQAYLRDLGPNSAALRLLSWVPTQLLQIAAEVRYHQ